MANGHIRKRGNSYQVVVFAGRDPVTKREMWLRETARSEAEAERTRVRLLEQVEAGNSPNGRATVRLLLERWLAVAELEVSTREAHEGYIRRSIDPVFGDLPVSKLRPYLLDQFYAHLRRCRKLCDGTLTVDHRTNRPHECRVVRHRRRREHDCAAAGCRVIECRPHVCRPAAPATVRRIHSILSTALGYGVKWGWVETNPAVNASPPKLRQKEVDPPTPEEAGRLLNAAWESDEAFGLFLLLKMFTGARRSEVCALQWGDVLGEQADLRICRAYITKAGQKIIKDTKTHQARILALDEHTLSLIEAHREACRKLATGLGGELDEETGFIFNRDGLGAEPWLPDTVTHQFRRLARRIGLDDRLHDLRHFNATQLIAAGHDLRTVAGRLGHSGGGATTLKVYAHRTKPADQRAALFLGEALREVWLPGESARPAGRDTHHPDGNR